jgi:4-hydroxymandelate oxidase
MIGRQENEVSQLRTLASYEEAARQVLSEMAYAYYAGGARDEVTLTANRSSWSTRWLHYRTLVDVSQRSAHTTLLGIPVESPIICAPMAFHRLAHDEGERATVEGVGDAGSIFTLSTLSTVALEAVAERRTGPLWFQVYVYKDREVTADLVRRAEAAGYQGIVLTVDAAEIGTRERDEDAGFHLPEGMVAANLLRAGYESLSDSVDGSALNHYVRTLLDPSLTWADVDWLANLTHLPIIIKGIVRSDDALRAIDHGARAVVVSNHGGRQLDTAVPTALALPSVVTAVDGKLEIYVDGGIRRGTDVIKALALGADAVLLGRPILWGLAVNGRAGVRHVIDLLHAELLEGMALCGTPTIADITRDLIDP